jgi:hypothetical protein
MSTFGDVKGLERNRRELSKLFGQTPEFAKEFDDRMADLKTVICLESGFTAVAKIDDQPDETELGLQSERSFGEFTRWYSDQIAEEPDQESAAI